MNVVNKLTDELLDRENKNMNYYVDRTSRGKWDTEYHETLEAATNSARTQAWKNGEDFTIFKAVATVSKPELVNDAKVTDLS